MKNFFLFLFTALLLFSCDTTEINEFAMQASIDDELYESDFAQGTVNEDGSLTIEGSAHVQSITLNLSRLKEGNYRLGPESPNSATYVDMEGNIYTTAPDEPGMVIISKINSANKTLEGTFHFRAVQPGIDTVYVSRGFLYNISYHDQTTEPTDGFFEAKVDDEPFVAVAVSAIDDGQDIVINGVAPGGTMGIVVPNTVTAGDYTLPQNGFNANYQDSDGPQTATQGTITIVEHNLNNQAIKGTFFFTTDLREITEGQFEVVYQ